MTDHGAALDGLFSPRVTVHIGASESGVYPAQIFQGLMISDTELYAVNPNRESVFGLPCYASVAKLPRRADLAIITVPRQFVAGALSECIAAGVRAAVVISSGFAEAGAEGATLQHKIEELSRDILVLGPNCAGFANIADNIIATRLAAPSKRGGLSFVSQSGALMMALHGSFSERGIGLRQLVSVGNQAGLRAEDILAHFVQDPETRVISAFLEGLRDGGRFARALQESLVAGKPVVLVKSGRTDVGQRLASTHTAAVAGEERVFESVCRQYGAVLVDDVDEMLSTSLLFERLGSLPMERIAYITQSGGLGSLTGDIAKLAGLEPRAFSPKLEARLRRDKAVPDYQPILNPIDLRGDSMRGAGIAATTAPFFESEEVDLVVLLFAKSPNRSVEKETAEAVISLRDRFGKPVIVVWVGQFEPAEGVPATRLMQRGGIPVFESSGAALRALSRVAAWRAYRAAYLDAEGGSNALLP